MPMTYPIMLTVAGSDSGGGAGIQADLKTASALGVYAATTITAVTAQNTAGVDGIQPILPDIVGSQIDAVFSDIAPTVVKLGMLFSSEIIHVVANRLEHYKPAYIIADPVMISTSGSKLLSDDAIEAMEKRIIPLATILTPNRMEAEHLSGIRIGNYVDICQAASRISEFGCKYVLMKGGHFDSLQMTDYLFDNDKLVHQFPAPAIATNNLHGTGCTLSSAIAANLALGHSVVDSVALAKDFVQKAIVAGKDISIWKGHGPLNHLFAPVPLHPIQKK